MRPHPSSRPLLDIFQTLNGGFFVFFVSYWSTIPSLGPAGEAHDEVEPISLSSLILHTASTSRQTLYNSREALECSHSWCLLSPRRVSSKLGCQFCVSTSPAVSYMPAQRHYRVIPSDHSHFPNCIPASPELLMPCDVL